MTRRIEEVLELIDGALGDYELSGDAMRWSPALADTAAPAAGEAVLDRLVAEGVDDVGLPWQPPMMRCEVRPVFADGGPVLPEGYRAYFDTTGLDLTPRPVLRSAVADAEREALLRRLAAGLDVPEWVVGLGDPPPASRWRRIRARALAVLELAADRRRRWAAWR